MPVARALEVGDAPGRVVRDVLWQGFNADPNGRQVFDRAMPLNAGSRNTWTPAPFPFFQTPTGIALTPGYACLSQQFPNVAITGITTPQAQGSLGQGTP